MVRRWAGAGVNEDHTYEAVEGTKTKAEWLVRGAESTLLGSTLSRTCSLDCQTAAGTGRQRGGACALAFWMRVSSRWKYAKSSMIGSRPLPPMMTSSVSFSESAHAWHVAPCVTPSERERGVSESGESVCVCEREKEQ